MFKICKIIFKNVDIFFLIFCFQKIAAFFTFSDQQKIIKIEENKLRVLRILYVLISEDNTYVFYVFVIVNNLMARCALHINIHYFVNDSVTCIMLQIFTFAHNAHISTSRVARPFTHITLFILRNSYEKQICGFKKLHLF